jgi:hypothetical protein
MRRALVTAVLTTGLIVGGTVAANAAATRAEYIAQADPICQRTIDAERQALGPKGTVLRLLKKGRNNAAARRYRHNTAAFSTGVEQQAALVAPVADAHLIGTWVQMLRAQIPVANRATAAMAHGRPVAKFFARLGSMNVKTRALVADFGFQYCQNL